MKTQTKVLLGAAALVVGIVLFRRRGVRAFFGELNLVNCKCMSTEFFPDGTSRSTPVDISRCIADPDLSEVARNCAGNSQIPAIESFPAKEEQGPVTVATLFGN